LHENCISVMENLSHLKELVNLNLSDNLIKKIESIEGCDKLDSLYLGRNHIGRNGLSDLSALLECPSITCLDVQSNQIDDPEVLPQILMKMPNLKVLYMQNNPVCKKIRNYRKTIISSIPNLKYLDDRPVFEDDRRHAEAFARGGIDEERKEREVIKKEKAAKDEKNRQAFKAMIAKARAEKAAADEKKKQEEEAKKAQEAE